MMDRRSPNYCNIQDQNAPDTHVHDTTNLIQIVNPWVTDPGRATDPRPYRCPRSLLKCCGSCVHICPARCVWDVQSRLYLIYAELRARNGPIPGSGPSGQAGDGDTDTQAAPPTDPLLKVLSNPEGIPYQQATSLVDQLTSGYFMSREQRRRVHYYDPTNRENPNKFDYAPRVEVDPKTGRPQVDPNTGLVRVIHWPESGLCQYCLPRVAPKGRPGRPRKTDR